MKYDADKVQHPHYNQSMLENGFEIEAEGTNALEAFEKACSQRNIPFYSYSNDKLKGWFNSLFGLGDVYMGDGLWKYWVQYYEGTYNQFTLGYYTNGGNFQIIYDITSEDMSGGGGGADPSLWRSRRRQARSEALDHRGRGNQDRDQFREEERGRQHHPDQDRDDGEAGRFQGGGRDQGGHQR